MAISENPSSFPDGSGTDLSFDSSLYTPLTTVDESSADQRAKDADAMFDDRIAQVDLAPESFALEELQTIETRSRKELIGEINFEGGKVSDLILEALDVPRDIMLDGKKYRVTHIFRIRSGDSPAHAYLILPGDTNVYMAESDGRIATAFGQNQISVYRFDGMQIVCIPLVENLGAVNQLKDEVKKKFKKVYPDKVFVSDILVVAKELGIDTSKLESFAGAIVYKEEEGGPVKYRYNPKFGLPTSWPTANEESYDPSFAYVLDVEESILMQLDKKLTSYLPANLETTINDINSLKAYVKRKFDRAYPGTDDPSPLDALTVADSFGD